MRIGMDADPWIVFAIAHFIYSTYWWYIYIYGGGGGGGKGGVTIWMGINVDYAEGWMRSIYLSHSSFEHQKQILSLWSI